MKQFLETKNGSGNINTIHDKCVNWHQTSTETNLLHSHMEMDVDGGWSGGGKVCDHVDDLWP